MDAPFRTTAIYCDVKHARSGLFELRDTWKAQRIHRSEQTAAAMQIRAYLKLSGCTSSPLVLSGCNWLFWL